jgi:hypothetical protein
MNRSLFRCLMAAMMFTLGGCASLAPSAVARLASFDPLSADPSAIAIAVRTSDRLRLRTGDVKLRVALQSDDAALAFDERFDLEVMGGDVGSLPGGTLISDEHVLLARVAADDRARLAETQARARATKGKGKGSIEVSVSGGCRTGDIEPAKLRFSAYMRTEDSGAFFPLTRDVSLARMVGADAVAALPPCDGAAT